MERASAFALMTIFFPELISISFAVVSVCFPPIESERSPATETSFFAPIAWE